MRELVFLSAAFRAANKHALGGSDHQPAGLEKKFFARFLFKLCPELVSALNHGNIKRVLKIGFADDASQAMGGAEIVRRLEAVQAKNPFSVARQVIGGGAAHRAKSGNDDVVEFQ